MIELIIKGKTCTTCEEFQFTIQINSGGKIFENIDFNSPLSNDEAFGIADIVWRNIGSMIKDSIDKSSVTCTILDSSGAKKELSNNEINKQYNR